MILPVGMTTFEEMMASIEQELMDYIDYRAGHTDEPREALAAEAGKALLILGSTFVGNSLGLEPEAGLQPGIDAVKRFQEIALQMQEATT